MGRRFGALSLPTQSEAPMQGRNGLKLAVTREPDLIICPGATHGEQKERHAHVVRRTHIGGAIRCCCAKPTQDRAQMPFGAL